MWASNPPNPLSPLALPQTFSSDILHIKLYFLSSPLSVRLLNSFPSILIQQDVRIFSLRKFLTFLCFLSHRNIAPSASPKAMADLLMVILSLRHDFVFTVSYVLLTVHPCIIFFKWSQLGAHYFLVYLFQLLYMFQPTMCPSSEELTVSMLHSYFSLCTYGWLSGLLVGMRLESHPDQQTRQPPTQREKYQCRIDRVSSSDDGHIVARNM